MTGRDQGAQEQLLRTLVERVAGRGAPGRRRSRPRRRPLPSPAAPPAAAPPSTGPRTGRGPASATCRRLGSSRGSTPASSSPPMSAAAASRLQRPDVKPQRAAGQVTGSPRSNPGSCAAAAQIGQAPAQRPERVVRLGEQLGRQHAPGHRPVGQRDPAKQRPGLLPAWRLARLPGPVVDTRRAEQPHPHAHRRRSSACGGSRWLPLQGVHVSGG